MTKITCKKCQYAWTTKSKLLLVTCPSCQIKAPNKNTEAAQ